MSTKYIGIIYFLWVRSSGLDSWVCYLYSTFCFFIQIKPHPLVQISPKNSVLAMDHGKGIINVQQILQAEKKIRCVDRKSDVCVCGGDVSRLFSIWEDCERKVFHPLTGQYTNRVPWTDPATGQSLLCFPFAPSQDSDNIYMNVNGQRIHFQQGSQRRTPNLTGNQLAIPSNCVPWGYTWLTRVWTSIGSRGVKGIKVFDR